MARRRAQDTCRFCGDQSLIDPDTFRSRGICAGCDTPVVKRAAKQRRAIYRADRESVVVREESTPVLVTGPCEDAPCCGCCGTGLL
jgi:hypothetical protein